MFQQAAKQNDPAPVWINNSNPNIKLGSKDISTKP